MAVEKVLTPEFRVSFPNVFRAQAMEEGKEPKFGLTLLFKKGADLSKLKAMAKEAIIEKWGSDREKWPKNLKTPFRDQGEKEFEGYEEGAIFFNATSKQRPGLIDAGKQEIIDESDFYPGCWARATVVPFSYDKKGNKGVAFGLRNIQKLRDGEPLGGRTRPEDDFEEFDNGEESSSSDSGDDIFD